VITEDEFWQREWKIASNWGAWGLNAYGLKRAAEVLWSAGGEDAAVGVAAMMLTGYALENAIKTLLLHRKPELCTPERAPRWPGGGHDLARLFDEGGIGVSVEERRLLDRLSEFVLWRGRYTMPQSREALRAGKALQWVTSPYPFEASPGDREIAYRLFDRALGLLPI